MKRFLGLIKKNREADPKTWDFAYASEVNSVVRTKYRPDEVEAILRKEIASLGTALREITGKEILSEEFKELNDWAEKAKTDTKSKIE